MTPARHIALLLAVLASPGVLADDATAAPGPSGAATGGAASRGPSDNLCFGGLEDGKIIVSEPYLENPYKQTTRLGCEVDGGSPVTMPDLPAPDAAKTRLA
ncbi:MAG: hypothetical protein PVH91_01160 [Pseudomonadales bacterium]